MRNSQSRADESERVGGTTSSPEPPGTGQLLRSFITREVWTVVFTPSYVLLGLLVMAVVLGLSVVGGGIHAGYVPTALDLLTPLEVLVPVVAVAFGYRSIRSAERRGELDVLATYPVSAWQIVLGSYAGRAVGLLLAVTLPLLVIMIPIAVTDPIRMPLFATHTGADSPVLFLRFVVLTTVFALVVLALTMAVSAVVSSSRGMVAAAGLVLLVVVFGADLAIAFGFSAGLISEDSLLQAISLSPLSAYRGLVLETVVTTTAGTGPRAASPVASLFSMAVWWAGSLAVAVMTLER